MIIRKICILGGTGFVGTQLANRLTRERYALKVLTRRRERHRHLLVLPTLDLVEADVHDPQVLTDELAGCDAVVNLVGILNERGNDGSGFRRAHVELAAKVVDACKANRISRLLHMSALNADAKNGPSHYLRTKGEAEDLVHSAASEDFQVTSFRPSVIFGPGDSFFNRFASLLKMAPVCFPLACPNSRFAPVYVEDVAEAMARSVQEPATYGQRYELCGPSSYTLEELVHYTAGVCGLRRWILPLGEGLSRRQARLLEWAPGKPFSRDNYASLQIDSVCHGKNGLAAFGIKPVALEAVVPRYLGDGDENRRYQAFRSHAHRDEDSPDGRPA